MVIAVGMRPKLRGDTLYTVMALLGANVMPHTFYLRSPLAKVLSWELGTAHICTWICQSLLVPCKCWPCAFNMLCLVLVKPMFWHYIGFLVGCCYWTEANHNRWKPVSWNTMWKEYVGCNWSFWVCIGGKCSFVDCCSYQFLQHRIGGPHTPGCPCTHGAGMFGKTRPSMHVSCWILDLIFLHLGM